VSEPVVDSAVESTAVKASDKEEFLIQRVADNLFLMVSEQGAASWVYSKELASVFVNVEHVEATRRVTPDRTRRIPRN
jgi:hypothetical protein